MASGPGPRTPSKHYYSVLGLPPNASSSSIRSAYKKLAMRWHPDKCSVEDSAEAKMKFQEIQEAYAVLSDQSKKALYDNGVYDPRDDDHDHDTGGLGSFVSEMAAMMADVKAKEAGKGSSFEELQQLFVSMFSADLAAFNHNNPTTSATSINFGMKQSRGGSHSDGFSIFSSCFVQDGISSQQTHSVFTNGFENGKGVDSSASKRTANHRGATHSDAFSIFSSCIVQDGFTTQQSHSIFTNAMPFENGKDVDSGASTKRTASLRRDSAASLNHRFR